MSDFPFVIGEDLQAKHEAMAEAMIVARKARGASSDFDALVIRCAHVGYFHTASFTTGEIIFGVPAEEFNALRALIYG